MKPILKYPGSKWRIAQEIVNLFPQHRSYVEPFFGSGAVLFNKELSSIETINDIDNDIVNLFQIIRDEPEKMQDPFTMRYLFELQLINMNKLYSS